MTQVYTETTTPLTGNAVFTGPGRDSGAGAGALARDSKFNAYAFANVAGTLKIEASNDGTTWYRAIADQAVGAGAAVIASIPVIARLHRAVFTNGAGAQATFVLNTSYTAA